MNEQEILDGNKLIAEFEGAIIHKGTGNNSEHTYATYPLEGEFDGATKKITSLFYNCDWNWLMPVVEKIENLEEVDCSFFIVCNECDIAFTHKCFEDGREIDAPSFRQKTSNKIESTWLAVVEFVKWHNQNKP